MRDIDLTPAVKSCGRGDFQAVLLGLLADWLKADRSGVLQYSALAMPHYILTDHVPRAEVDLYLQGAYRFDPFYRHWCDTARPGLVTLQGARDAGDYQLLFQPKTGMADEIALICAKRGGAADNFFFLRESLFSEAELDALRRVFPMIEALYELNQNLALRDLCDGRGAGLIAEAVVIDDRHGQEIRASDGWAELVGQSQALSDTVHALRRGAPGQLEVTEDIHVISELLDEGFGPCPGGRITFVVERRRAAAPLEFSEVLERLFADCLTPREISICALVLQGYPSASIAEKLEIALGTVKNHRKSIHRKLDITSERELFLMLIRHVSG